MKRAAGLVFVDPGTDLPRLQRREGEEQVGRSPFGSIAMAGVSSMAAVGEGGAGAVLPPPVAAAGTTRPR